MRISSLIIIWVFVCIGNIQLSGQAIEHKPKQMFISPFVSLGSATILNQNNYGYHEMAYSPTFGGQAGIMLGWDYYLKNSFKTGVLLSKWGQHYSDVFSDKKVKKEVNNYYVQVPATFKHVFGKKRGYDHEVFNPYIFGSVLVSYLFYSDVKWLREDASGVLSEQSMLEFVTSEGAWNANSEQIIEQGNPEKDKKLFSPIDINISVGGGYQYFISRRTSLFAELQLSGGLLDINAGNWRFRNDKNVYQGSHNLYAGINLGANIYLYK